MRSRTLGNVVAVPEQIGERGATPGDPGADRAGRDVQHGRDLRVVEAGEVAERDGGPVFGRERGERGVDVEGVGDPRVRGSASVDAGSGRSSTGVGRRFRRRASSSAAFVATR